jgi:hypothetical protein
MIMSMTMRIRMSMVMAIITMVTTDIATSTEP